MKFRLDEIARALNTSVPTGCEARLAEGWSIDSRTLQPGDVFFALSGPQHDGHAYVEAAWRRGAGAAVVSETFSETPGLDHVAYGTGCLLRVANPLHALQTLAGWARRQWRGQVVAVTGSAGKTTSKEMIAEMLSLTMHTDKNPGNLNNHIGLPLSLLRLQPKAQVAVLEMGMNHSGEIRDLARIALPDVGVVTNVGYAHVENFDSIHGIAAAKRELIEALPASGTAVLNADDPLVREFSKVHAKCLLYGLAEHADVRGEDLAELPEGTRFRVGNAYFDTPLKGRHNVSNILSAIAVARVFGIAPHLLADRVSKLQPGKMRGERLLHQDISIFNDCYNSNPEAARAMLDVLRDTTAKKRIAVLGEMLELGSQSEELHREVGQYAARAGIDVLIGIQGSSRAMIEAAKKSGMPQAFYVDDAAEAGALARKLAGPGDAILFKGSRGVKVEKAVEQFIGANPGGAN